MPIKQLKTISMAVPVKAADPAVELPEDKQAAFYSLMESFLLLNPSPSDEHIHQLATAVGMDPATFEQLIYKTFSETLRGDEDGDLLTDPEDSEPEVDESQHAALMARLQASNVDDMPMNKGLFDTDDIEPIEAATTTEAALMNRAYKELAAALRGTGDHYSGDALVDHLVEYAEGQPDYDKVFGKSSGAAINARRAAQEFLKNPPFKIESADADGNAAEGDGAPDPEVDGTKDPMKEASEGDGAVDEELIKDAGA